MAFKDHWNNRLWPGIKIFGTVVFAVPTIIALVDLFTFGISLNNSTVAPLLRPRLECLTTKVPGVTEGGHPIYDVVVTSKLPRYLQAGF